ncbi:MAG: DUF4830 domain-containing protein [Ruminococcus sp.]|nr:DUF4830 domain-containing protein [Ruminococcus sp.]
MFVVSVKSSKLKSVGILMLVVVFATIGAVYFVSKNADKPVSKQGSIILKASTADERTSFFSQFGWEINEEPCEVKEVVIPAEFDDVYNEYNVIQKEQGLDLEKYKGTRAKLWSYEIKNYPGYENTSDVIRGNILVYDGVIIGGDVSSVELDGFMHTFYRPDTAQQSG